MVTSFRLACIETCGAILSSLRSRVITRSRKYFDYKNGAVLLLNHHLETDILAARGKAYGVEFMIKKSAGKLNGWISYTYSRSFLRTDGIYSSEIVNHGKYYPSSYDKPHAVNFISNYKFSRRFNFSLNVVYSTGRADHIARSSVYRRWHGAGLLFRPESISHTGLFPDRYIYQCRGQP